MKEYICPECGEIITESANFCSYCGLNLHKVKEDASKSCEIAFKFYKNDKLDDFLFWIDSPASKNDVTAFYLLGMYYINKMYKKTLDAVNIDKAIDYFVKVEQATHDEHPIKYLFNIYIGYYNKNYYDFSLAQEYYNKLSLTTREKIGDIDGLKPQDTDSQFESIAEGNFDIKNGKITKKDFSTITNVENNVFYEENQKLKDFYKKLDFLITKNDYSLPYKNGEYYNTDQQFDEATGKGKLIDLRKWVDSLINSKPSPYFGRLIVKKDNDDSPKDFLFGDKTISDDNSTPLVFSFTNSDLARAFYASDDKVTYITKTGELLHLNCRRRIIIENCNLIDVVEDYNNGEQDNFIADAYLKKIIEQKHKTSELTDIVRSIQSAQYQIISADSNKSLILQGCAGCGKTMVLLHRIKYLIANNYRGKICVITPSKIFNDFISPVLRKLEISGVLFLPIADYYKGVLNAYQSDDRVLELFSEKNNLDSKPLVLEDDTCLPKEVVSYYYSNDFIIKVNALQKVTIKPIAKSTFSDQKEEEKMTKDGKIDLLEALLGTKEKKLLPEYSHRIGTIHKCELFALCLFYSKRCGIKKYSKDQKNPLFDFMHDLILIDEAQDISIPEYEMIGTINRHNAIYNLYGDTNQTISNYGLNNWNDVTNVLGDMEEYTLSKNYRNSSQIIDYVNNEFGQDMTNIGYEGEYMVCSISSSVLIRTFTDYKNKRNAIICSAKEQNELKYKFPLYKDIIYNVSEIKGMEFDSVYVFPNGMSRNEKYIACTRALERLTIIKD